MTQDGRTTTYTLDVGGQRLRSWTDNNGTATTTKQHHYDGDGDSPAWTDEGNSQYTRVVSSLGGDVTAIRGTDGTVEFQLANLHGDIAATTAADLTTQPGLLTTSDTTEYGTPRDTTTIGTRRYGWLGAKQRAGDTPSGVTLMGVRLNNPATGRFLTVDPVYGGSANDYDYCNGDPINCTDLDGRQMCKDCGGPGGVAAGGSRCGRSCWWGAAAAGRYVARNYRWAGRQMGRIGRWGGRINLRMKESAGRYLSRRYNGGRSRVEIDGAAGRWRYDLWGKAHGGVRTPHKVWQPRNARSPHGWGKSERFARPMRWRDFGRVWVRLRFGY